MEQLSHKECAMGYLLPTHLSLSLLHTHPPWVLHGALFEVDVRCREDAFAVLVSERKAAIPPAILLQNLDHISKLEPQERVGGLLRVVAVDHCVCVCVYETSEAMRHGVERTVL